MKMLICFEHTHFCNYLVLLKIMVQNVLKLKLVCLIVFSISECHFSHALSLVLIFH